MLHGAGAARGRAGSSRRAGEVRGEWVDLRPRDVVVGASHKLHDYAPDRFGPVSPDATLELRIPIGESPLRFDLLVEIDHGAQRSRRAEDRLRRYDGLISGWAGMLDRYKALGTPPMVVFVCEDERRREEAGAGSPTGSLTARLASRGPRRPSGRTRAGGRSSSRSSATSTSSRSRAVQLPELPARPPRAPHARQARPRRCDPRRVHLIEPKLIDLA